MIDQVFKKFVKFLKRFGASVCVKKISRTDTGIIAKIKFTRLLVFTSFYKPL